MKTTGERIVAARTQKRMSARALAKRAGLSPGYISQIETGTRTGTIDTLRAIAGALGMPLSELTADYGGDGASIEVIGVTLEEGRVDSPLVRALADGALVTAEPNTARMRIAAPEGHDAATCFAIEVVGESFHWLPQGALLVFDSSQKEPRPDALVIVADHGRGPMLGAFTPSPRGDAVWDLSSPARWVMPLGVRDREILATCVELRVRDPIAPRA